MEPISILALEKTPKVGPKTVEKILSMNPRCELSSPSDLIKIFKKANTKFSRIPVPDTNAATIGWNKAHEIWELSQQHDIQIISKENSHYPGCLLQIPNPPVLLHVLGNIDALNRDCIAIVGTRKPTEYGINAARKLGTLFAKKGYVVVSGLANGIDTAAHRGALDANGLTVAVLAHGLDTVYPGKNKELADEILKNNGALVSEYSWGTKTNRSYFIARDRIQSGLSLGVFVVETGVKGGTMHTVKFCREQKRALIVLKHPKYPGGHPETRGNAQLILDGDAMIFETDEDMDIIMIEMNRVKKKLQELLLHQDHQTKKKDLATSIQSTLDLI